MLRSNPRTPGLRRRTSSSNGHIDAPYEIGTYRNQACCLHHGSFPLMKGPNEYFVAR